ncbi:hypothetical protein [Streptomyces avicenniae]|uniref:hypothetical protein n=1 Tax=Streptomyces avicenniae TaxID=500153 RepID=UPI00167CB77D|nr:hypothetical protein [Streptomyces avicenniae]
MSRTSQSLGAALATITLLGACSSSEEPEEGPTPLEHPLSAEEVCGGTLAAFGAEALESLSHGVEFSEMVNEPRAEVGAFADELRRPHEGTFTFCTIYTPDYESSGLATVRFSWSPTSAPTSSPSPVSGATANFAAGRSAWTGESSAFMLFSCPVAADEERSELLSRLDFIQPGASYEPDLMMEVLNAMTGAVAEELGCAEEAGLPSGAPQRIEG